MGLPFKTNLPEKPVSLTTEQAQALYDKLRTMRHDVHGSLGVIAAILELMKYKPQESARFVASLAEQPARIQESLRKFSAEFESAFEIRRPPPGTGSAKPSEAAAGSTGPSAAT